MERSYTLGTKHGSLLGFYLFWINVLLGHTSRPYFIIDMGRTSYRLYAAYYLSVPSITEFWYFKELIYLVITYLGPQKNGRSL